jgi:type II secretory pathway component PulL
LDEAPLRNVPPALRGEVASFVSPLGLALREAAPNDTIGVNFRQGEFAYHRGQEEVRRALWRTGTLALLVIALVIADTFMSYQQVAARLDLVRAQVRNVFTQTLPDVHRITDERTQLQAEIDAAQKKLQILGGVAPLGGATALDAMRALAATIPDTLKIDIDEYIMDPESIRIKAKTDSFEMVDSIKQQVVNTHYFADVQVKDVKAAPEGKGVDFRLVLALNKDGAGASAKP